MQYDDRLARRMAALFDIEDMPIAHIDHALVKWFDRRIQQSARVVLSDCSVHFGDYIDICEPPCHAKDDR